MSGRRPQAPAFNPGVRSSAQQLRRMPAAAKPGARAWGPPPAAAAAVGGPQAAAAQSAPPVAKGRGKGDAKGQGEGDAKGASGNDVSSVKPRTITEEAVKKVLDVLARGKRQGHLFFVGRLIATGRRGYILRNLYTRLDTIFIPGITFGQREYSSVDQANTIWFNAVTCLGGDVAKAKILEESTKVLRNEIEKMYFHAGGERECWVQEPVQLEWVSGPSQCYEGCPIEGERKGWFKVFKAGTMELDLKKDITGAACSNNASLLETMLEKSFCDVGIADVHGVTATHLAVLSGHVGVARAVIEEAVKLARPHWQDRDGRTPLHMAALFTDPNLAAAALELCDKDTKDQWGLTAEDIARGLENEAVSAFLAGVPVGLHQLSMMRSRELLGTRPAPPAVAAMLRDMPYSAVSCLADNIPLHDYPALSTLAEAFPGLVPPERVARSMSCMECWYGDLFLKGMGAGVSEEVGLVSVWDDLSSFSSGAQSASHGLSGTVLAASRIKDNKKPPTVADRETFLRRFHERTGGIFRDIDWSNLRVIGGMCLACLIADDEDFNRYFKDTDVDFYVVGLSRAAYKSRVASFIESMPMPRNANDRFESLEPLLHGGDKWHFSWKQDLRNNSLVITEVREISEVQKKLYCREPRLNVGDHILEVSRRVEYCPDNFTGAGKMERELIDAIRNPKTSQCWFSSFSKRTVVETVTLCIRPDKDMPTNKKFEGFAMRTPQTITVCSRVSGQGYAHPLPNTQIVLAPYSSTAHLLFTTDIDCTAMAFDGSRLLATPRAREAIRHRRNIVRPEKYMVRGEFRTEARLLKYARRGFEVFDLGIKPGGFIPKDKALDKVNTEAADLFNESKELGMQAHEIKENVEAQIRRIQGTDVHGAQLLFQAARSFGLRMAMTFEKPLLRAGMGFNAGVELVRSMRTRSHTLREPSSDEEDQAQDAQEETDDDSLVRSRLGLDGRAGPHRGARGSGGAGGSPGPNQDEIQYNDGYGKAKSKCVMVNPMSRQGGRVGNGSLRGLEMSLSQAIEEMDLESDRFEVRSWYDGIAEGALNAENATLDPSVWRGIGDFRKAD